MGVFSDAVFHAPNRRLNNPKRKALCARSGNALAYSSGGKSRFPISDHEGLFLEPGRADEFQEFFTACSDGFTGTGQLHEVVVFGIDGNRDAE